jgi:hypothetical protein
VVVYRSGERLPSIFLGNHTQAAPFESAHCFGLVEVEREPPGYFHRCRSRGPCRGRPVVLCQREVPQICLEAMVGHCQTSGLPKAIQSDQAPIQELCSRYGLPLHPEIRDQASALLPPGDVLYDLAYRACRYCFQDRTLEHHPRS